MRWIGLALSLAMAACAPGMQMPSISAADAAAEAEIQREIAFEAAFEDQLRLQRVAGRVKFGAAELCGDRVKPAAGVLYATAYQYPFELRTIARKVANVGDTPRIVLTIPGSPADKAGLLPGDEITAVNATPVVSGANAEQELRRLVEAEGKRPYTLTMKRAASFDAQITPDPACDFGVKLSKNDRIQAAADGRQIILTQGMMRFVRDDDELAFVVAHELAHNTMRHLDKKRGNVIAGSAAGLVFDILAAAAGVNTGGAFTELGGRAGASAYSKGFEAEADYVALYMLAQGGFPIEGSPKFWRRIATVDPKSIDFARTHPTTPERFVQMEATIREIRAKMAAGEALEPNPKKKVFDPSAGGVDPAAGREDF